MTSNHLYFLSDNNINCLFCLFFRQNDFLVHNLSALCRALDDVNTGVELVQVIALHDLTVNVEDFYYSDDFFIFEDFFHIQSLAH